MTLDKSVNKRARRPADLASSVQNWFLACYFLTLLLTKATRKVIFYTTPTGNAPVQEFLDSLSAKETQKIVWVLNLIESLPMVPQEYFKKMQNSDGIREFRAQFGNNAFRLLGFLDKGRFVILTNGFSKKSQKTPHQEIALAEQRKKEYQER